MGNFNKLLSNSKNALYWLIVAFLCAASVAYAVPPATRYQVGETLDPNCAPGDPNCLVEILPDQTSNSGKFLTTNGTVASWGGVTSGTVTSFSSGNLSPLFTTSVSNSTTTPALTFSLVSQSQNLVYASPNGSSGTPTFRSLVAADMPFSNTTASNGLTKTVNDIALGGTLTGNTTITGADKQLAFTFNTLAGTSGLDLSSASTTATGNAQKVLNISLSGANATSTQSTYGVYSSNTHTGTLSTNYGGYFTSSGGSTNFGVYGSSPLYGVYGVSTSNGVGVYGSVNNAGGYGMWAENLSSGGIGTLSSSNNGYAGYLRTDRPTLTNNVLGVLDIVSSTSGGVGSNGIGGSIDFQTATSSGGSSVQTSNQLISKWTDATNATRTSRFTITGVNSTVTGDIAAFDGTGVVGVGISSGFGATRLEVVDNSLAGANMVSLTSTSTAAAGNAQKVLNISLSGVSATTGQSTYSIYASNTHTEVGGAFNYGIYGTASGITGGGANYGVYGTNSNMTGGAGVAGLNSGDGSGVRGTNITNGVGVFAENTGATGTGYALYASKLGAATTNIAGYFTSSGATNNYAILVPAGGGNVGFGLTNPTATKLEVADNTLAGASMVSLTSNSTAAASNLQKALNISMSGINSTSSQATYGVYSNNVHTGTGSDNYGLYGSATGGDSNTGVFGTSTGGTGVWGTGFIGVKGTSSVVALWGIASGSGEAVAASSVDAVAIDATRNPSSTNSIIPVIQIARTTSGTAANGIGQSLDFQVETSTNGAQISNQIISKWTDVTNATRTSEFSITGVDSAVTSTLFTIAGNGDTTINSGDLTVVGSATTCVIGNGTGATLCSSDERLKTNIEPLGDSLENIMALRPVTFTWRNLNKPQDTNIGFIAQEVQVVFPQFVGTINKDGTLGLDYAALITPTIKAVQELDLKVKGMTALPTDVESASFADRLMAWLANAGNHITRIFTGEICLTSPDGSSECLNKDELHQLKQLLQNGAPISNPPVSPPVTSSPSSTPPADTLPPADQIEPPITPPTDTPPDVPVSNSPTNDEPSSSQ